MAATNYRKQNSIWLFFSNKPFNKAILIGFVLVICSQFVPAQDNSKNKGLFLEAESFFLYEEYPEALPIYAKLNDLYPLNYNIDYKIGRCYINLPYDKIRAIDYLEVASKHISLTHKEGSLKENNAPLDALFFLGDAYRVNNQLEKAIAAYQSFKSQSNDKVYDLKLVDDQINACKLGIELQKSPIDVSESNLGDVINTRFSDTNPVVSENETVMVYASKLPFYQAVYYTKKENGKWSSPVNIISDLGIDDDCLPTSISADETELYLYRSNEFKGDIYVSNFKNGKWSKIRKLNDNINTKYWESHACISHDGKTLYFTSNRKEGYGGLDIYKSTRSFGDNWGLPVNLGSAINSPYNEETPFVSTDGKRLYFSSFGHETMGGYDVFSSDLKADGSWAKPVNMGYPVNTSDDDLFFNPLRDGSIAYISKFDADGKGKYDIYRYDIFSNQNTRKYHVNGNVQIPYSWTDIAGLRVTVYDKNKKDTILRKVINADKFSFETSPGNYEVSFSGAGLQPQTLALVINTGSKKTDIALKTIMKIQPMQLVLAAPESISNAKNKLVKNKHLVDKTNNALIYSTLNKNADLVKITEVDNKKLPTSKPIVNIAVATNNPIKSNIPSLPYLFLSGIIAIGFVLSILIIKRRRNDNQKST